MNVERAHYKPSMSSVWRAFSMSTDKRNWTCWSADEHTYWTQILLTNSTLLYAVSFFERLTPIDLPLCLQHWSSLFYEFSLARANAQRLDEKKSDYVKFDKISMRFFSIKMKMIIDWNLQKSRSAWFLIKTNPPNQLSFSLQTKTRWF